MTRQKDFKRLVRERMQKTGESYTTARAHLVAKRSRAASHEAPSAPGRDYAAIAGVRDALVRETTGKTWAQWVRALDRAGAATHPHAQIVALARAVSPELTHWWAQTVTVGYERIRGLRDVGQQRGGTYEVSKSRTYPVPLRMLYRAFAEARVRRKWLPVEIVVRTSRREKSMRITWDDETHVDAYFIGKGPSKSTVAIQHRKLPARAARETAKARWGERLDALGDLLT